MSEKPCKHKFQPRYSVRAPKWLTVAIENGTLEQLNGFPEYEKIYECDVCVRCGKITCDVAQRGTR